MRAERVAALERAQHHAQRGDAGHVLGAGTLARLLAAAHDQRRERGAGAHVQHADAFGRIQFMPGERRVIDAGYRQIERQLAQRLYAIDHPVGGGAGLGDDALDAVEIGDHAGFVVGRHGADQRRRAGHLAQQFQVVRAAAIHRQFVQGQVQAEQMIPVRQAFRHGLVFSGAVDQQMADGLATGLALAQRHQRRQYGGLDAFGGATVEHQAAIVDAKQTAGAGARLVQHGLGLQAGRVGAAGIAEALAHSVERGGDGGRQNRSGGVAVEVDFSGHGGGLLEESI